ncbi:MAG: hypothetical protein ABSE18_04440 [Minisyncoccia bacterium]|jgi:hypothetical protein
MNYGYQWYSLPRDDDADAIYGGLCSLFLIAVIASAAKYGPWPMNLGCGLYLAGMVGYVAFVMWIGPRRDPETTMFREFAYFWRNAGLLKLTGWPAFLLGDLISPQSERGVFISMTASGLRRKSHTIHANTAYEIGCDDARRFDGHCDSVALAANRISDTAVDLSAAACRTTALTAALAGATNAALAQTPGGTTVVVTTKFLNGYDRKNDNMVHDGPVVQSDVLVTFGNGAFFDLWGSTGLDFRPNGGREIDWTVGWGGKHISAGLTYFDLAPLFSRGGNGDMFFPFFETRKKYSFRDSHHALTPFFIAEGVILTKGTSRNSGAFISGGLRHRWTISKRVAFGEEWKTLLDTGVFRRNRGLVPSWSASLDVKLGKRITLTPASVRLIGPGPWIHDQRKFHAVLGFGMSTRFGP